MLSQAFNRTMPHSRNQLEEGVNRKEIIFYLAVLYLNLENHRECPHKSCIARI